MEEKSVRKKLENVLEKQQMDLANALNNSSLALCDLFQYLNPNDYSTFMKTLKGKQVYDFLKDLDESHRNFLFSVLDDWYLFELILSKSEDTSVVKFVSDERLNKFLNDWPVYAELVLVFKNLSFENKCRMVNLLNEEKRLNWLNNCLLFMKYNPSNFFFEFIKELEFSDKKEQIYKKMLVLTPMMLVRFLKNDNEGIFTRNIIDMFSKEKNIVVLENFMLNI